MSRRNIKLYFWFAQNFFIFFENPFVEGLITNSNSQPLPLLFQLSIQNKFYLEFLWYLLDVVSNGFNNFLLLLLLRILNMRNFVFLWAMWNAEILFCALSNIWLPVCVGYCNFLMKKWCKISCKLMDLGWGKIGRFYCLKNFLYYKIISGTMKTRKAF